MLCIVHDGEKNIKYHMHAEKNRCNRELETGCMWIVRIYRYNQDVWKLALSFSNITKLILKHIYL